MIYEKRVGFRNEFMAPIDPWYAASPRSTMRADRNAALLGGLSFALLGPIFRLIGIDFAAALPFFAGIGWIMSSAYMRCTLACTLLALNGKLPFRAMTFIEDARRREVLRQDGAVYQFRNELLQRRLAAGP